MSHLQNCSLKIYFKVFVKIQKKCCFFCFCFLLFFFGGGGGGRVGSGGGVGLGGQGRCEQRSQVFVKIKLINCGGSVRRGGEWSGWGVRVDVIEELKFWENSQKKIRGGGRFGGGGSVRGWGSRFGGGGSGWRGQGGCE